MITQLCRLEAAFASVKRRLAALSIPVLEARAGLFCWADFRSDLAPSCGNSVQTQVKRAMNSGHHHLCQTLGLATHIIARHEL